MAQPLPDQPVPLPGEPNWSITINDKISPWSALWWTTGVLTDIPSDSVGWLLAQGWQIVGITYDSTTIPPTAYYSMNKQVLNTNTVLQNLLDDFTNRDNTAKWANEVRYNSVVLHWSELLENTEGYLDTQASEQAGHVTLYLGNLTTYMDEVDTIIESKSTDYDAHVTTATNFLTDLGATETARIQEKFTASLSTQLQQLTDRGLYSSGRAVDVTARNTRDHNEEIVALNDRLNREKWENQHRLYEQQFRMRETDIVQKMNESVARLSGLDKKHAEDMQLMKYMLSERNQLLVGLYGFVERRDDIHPSWENLAQVVAGLGDAGGGWISP